jgi:VIT1/CCC1 family predicted Fe2+/Mn2+ transporter
MKKNDDITRYRANFQDEIESAALYRVIAKAEKQPQLARVYLKMAEIEEEHAAFWVDKIVEGGAPEPDRKIGWRTKVLAGLAKQFGAALVLPTIANRERQGTQSYRMQPEVKNSNMPGQESSHERLLEMISGKSSSGMEGGNLATLEGRHRTGGNALRAAVLGANDGLLSNFSLVMGVAGAASAHKAILIAGMAGLLAGAGSMALGEWLSVQSSRELFQHQIEIEGREISLRPQEEQEELALIYQAKGLPEEQARQLAANIMANQETALDTLAREELGINPDELGGSAWEAAFTSFFLFALGAVFPIAPFFFTQGSEAVIISMVVSGIALFSIGALITILTGKNALLAGARQMLFGLLAAGITFAIGRLVGVTVGG